MADPRSEMVDVAFALAGKAVPREYRRALSDALEARVPGLADWPGAGVHRINVSAGAGREALLSGRSRLTLRVPRTQVDALSVLTGETLDIGGQTLQLDGPPRPRDLLPHGTLYAHLVAAASDDEAAFLAAVGGELQRLGIAGRCICGRLQQFDYGAQPQPGFSLMVDGLTTAHALRLLDLGVGPHRLWGCGLFVPHKSAAAVGGER
ncbi:type I-MYXAN CRISPR-associated protein Cas6/Cmx6 [Ideonella sp. A 288]|uniref:type I-MYXAN CRISPR-associated protein Cas6/Cmx6 n=1 Tax=Ideonella sp. A 288 TaxID=1962181 RepID=UPI0013033795|nr:type I-MYXAN CRISPR-associated protein Cas6/Cmx6 [Ideonella sp. A 288]